MILYPVIQMKRRKFNALENQGFSGRQMSETKDFRALRKSGKIFDESKGFFSVKELNENEILSDYVLEEEIREMEQERSV